ncbi:flagellar regulator YcgR PilZN domain-containing protein [Collimonas sp. NPDC087041]|uniref:flagellar regulator YcgR PilZN domain-containing protein n=1 Tax=Collimonas sp. NPDC087041 TaxID=3363960 RepID=UPI0038132D84
MSVPESSVEVLSAAMMEEVTTWLLQDPVDIESILRELERQSSAMTMRPLDGGEMVATRLVAVALAHGLFIHAGDPERNAAQYQPGELVCFEGAIDGAGISFISTVASNRVSPWPTALAAELPVCIDYYPHSKFIRIGMQPVETCVVRAKRRDGNDFVLNVHDLTARGIGLRSTHVPLHALPVGTVLPAAVLDFRSSGRLLVDLRVVFCRSVQGTEGIVNHFGCYYVDLDQARQSLGCLLTA